MLGGPIFSVKGWVPGFHGGQNILLHRFNTHWGNILLLDFLFSHSTSSDANIAITANSVLPILWLKLINAEPKIRTIVTSSSSIFSCVFRPEASLGRQTKLDIVWCGYEEWFQFSLFTSRAYLTMIIQYSLIK